MGNLIPWWGNKQVPVRREDKDFSDYATLYPDANRIFSNFFNSLSSFPVGSFENFDAFQPRVDVSETDKEVKLTAELPGMDENDIDVSVTRNAISIRGEKRREREENTNGYYKTERHYGSFHRVLPLPCDVDTENVEATFKNGVLHITLTKAEQVASQAKRITIKSSDSL